MRKVIGFAAAVVLAFGLLAGDWTSSSAQAGSYGSTGGYGSAGVGRRVWFPRLRGYRVYEGYGSTGSYSAYRSYGSTGSYSGVSYGSTGSYTVYSAPAVYTSCVCGPNCTCTPSAHCGCMNNAAPTTYGSAGQ